MPTPTEAQEQAALVQWLTLKGWLFTATAQATPAGRMTAAGWKPSFGTLRKNKALGVRKGFPDLAVIVPCGNGYKNVACFVEMKREDGVWSDVGPEQRKWIAALNACGCLAVPCFGAKDAIEFLEAVWLNHAAVWHSHKNKAPFHMVLDRGFVKVENYAG